MKNKNDGSSAPSSPTPTSAEAMPPPPDDAELASEPNPDDGLEAIATSSTGEKPKFSGNWSCSVCGTAITSLPFAPKNTNNLKCIDCFKQSKG